MRKRSVFLVALAGMLIMAWTAVAAAGEVIYVSEPSIFDTPTILPRHDASLWNMDFRRNPALLKLDCPYELILDAYYLGSYDKKSTGDFGNTTEGPPSFMGSSSEVNYWSHVIGGDVGFAMKLGERNNLAFIVNYRRGDLTGDGSFESAWNDAVAGSSGNIAGSIGQLLGSSTYGGTVFWDMKFSDKFTLGAALKYAYTSDYFENNIVGNGTNTMTGTESVDVDRDLWLNYDLVSPMIGISYSPTDRFTLDASVAAGFYVGTVEKKSRLYDSSNLVGITPASLLVFREDLDSHDYSGWDIAANVRPELKVSDRVSIPFVIDFRYRDITWSIDGNTVGYFTPLSYGGIFQGPGSIVYKNHTTSWDIMGGAGVKYDAGWATLTGLLGYTHWDFDNRYDQGNLVTDTTFGLNGLTSYSQDDSETREIVSIGLDLEKEFSPKISAVLGLRYDVGWGHREYGQAYGSPYETTTAPPETLLLSTDGSDTYQDITLKARMTYAPTKRLAIAFGAFVTIPVDPLDYRMTGGATGLVDGDLAFRDQMLDGDLSRDYENTGWEYGGLLSITYEFGCPVPVPPAAPPAPVIEPKLEPMSKN